METTKEMEMDMLRKACGEMGIRIIIDDDENRRRIRFKAKQNCLFLGELISDKYIRLATDKLQKSDCFLTD